MKNQQRTVNNALPLKRNIVKHIGGNLHAGSCIYILAKLCAYALHIRENPFSREVLCAIKAHMLKKMSKTILIGSLLNGAHISNNVKLRTLCRFFVMFNIIGKSVLQLTNLNARVVHNRLLRIKPLRICSNGQSHSEQNQKKSLHIVNIKKLSFLCYLLPQLRSPPLLLFPLCCSSPLLLFPSAVLFFSCAFGCTNTVGHRKGIQNFSLCNNNRTKE